MHKLNERGSLLLPLVVTGVLLLGAVAFGFWAFAGRQEYKNNSDEKIAEAVAAAETAISEEKDAAFAEEQKNPNRTYKGPEFAGYFEFSYPKTWSVYVDQSRGSTQLKGFMHPDVVPADSSAETFEYALRFEVADSAYDTVMKTYESNVKNGKLRAQAIKLEKVESSLGTELNGEISTKQQGRLVVLKVRDKTLKIWTEGDSFKADFDKIIKSLSFIP